MTQLHFQKVYIYKYIYIYIYIYIDIFFIGGNHSKNTGLNSAGLSCSKNERILNEITEKLLQSWEKGTKQCYNKKIQRNEIKLDEMQPIVNGALYFSY